MLAEWLADGVLALHFGFIIFALFGGLAVLRWRWLMWLHLPALLWAAAVELNGWICPLTPLENHLLAEAGRAGYTGGFIEHYLAAVIYPNSLTREMELLMGIALLLWSGTIYTIVMLRWRRARRPPPWQL